MSIMSDNKLKISYAEIELFWTDLNSCVIELVGVVCFQEVNIQTYYLG